MSKIDRRGLLRSAFLTSVAAMAPMEALVAMPSGATSTARAKALGELAEVRRMIKQMIRLDARAAAAEEADDMLRHAKSEGKYRRVYRRFQKLRVSVESAPPRVWSTSSPGRRLPATPSSDAGYEPPASAPEVCVPLSAPWIDLRAGAAVKDEAPLFLNLNHFKPGRRMTGDGLYKLIRALGDAAAIRARPHGLRHASITAALDTSNGDVRAVQSHARHANPQTTMRYDDNRQDLAGIVAAKLAGALSRTPGTERTDD